MALVKWAYGRQICFKEQKTDKGLWERPVERSEGETRHHEQLLPLLRGMETLNPINTFVILLPTPTLVFEHGITNCITPLSFRQRTAVEVNMRIPILERGTETPSMKGHIQNHIL